MNMNSPTAEEVAREARAALAKSRETPEQHFERLVRRGWINSRGEVTRLLGGEAEPESGAGTIPQFPSDQHPS
jgi:hypothetical protein